MIEIKPIEASQTEEAKQVIAAVCFELWQPQATLAEYGKQIEREGGFDDVNDLQNQYFDNGGTFLVLMDSNRVVGTGGVRRLEASVCELKRMWFLPQYRGRGLGTRLLMRLIEWARDNGFKTMRLDVADEVRSAPAVRLYERLGFTRIERYNESLCTVWMEKNIK
jgi:putative acetyltransferase